MRWTLLVLVVCICSCDHKGRQSHVFSKGKSDVFLYAELDDLENIHTYARNSGDLNVTNSDGFSLMEIAIINNSTNVAQFLLDEGVSEYAPHLKTLTIHSAAASTGAVDVLNIFLQEGMGANKVFDHWTPIMWAIHIDDLKNSILLLLNGADVYRENQHGRNAIYYALSGGIRNVSVLQSLELILANFEEGLLFVNDKELESQLVGLWSSDKTEGLNDFKLDSNGTLKFKSRDNSEFQNCGAWHVDDMILKINIDMPGMSKEIWLLVLKVEGDSFYSIEYEVTLRELIQSSDSLIKWKK